MSKLAVSLHVVLGIVSRSRHTYGIPRKHMSLSDNTWLYCISWWLSLNCITALLYLASPSFQPEVPGRQAMGRGLPGKMRGKATYKNKNKLTSHGWFPREDGWFGALPWESALRVLVELDGCPFSGICVSEDGYRGNRVDMYPGRFLCVSRVSVG